MPSPPLTLGGALRRGLASATWLSLAAIVGCGSKPNVHVEVADVKADLAMTSIVHTHDKNRHVITMFAHCPDVKCLASNNSVNQHDVKARCPNVEVVRIDFVWPLGQAPEVLPTGSYTAKAGPGGSTGVSGSYGTASKDHNLWNVSVELTSATPVAGKLTLDAKDAKVAGTFGNPVTTCAKAN